MKHAGDSTESVVLFQSKHWEISDGSVPEEENLKMRFYRWQEIQDQRDNHQYQALFGFVRSPFAPVERARKCSSLFLGKLDGVKGSTTDCRHLQPYPYLRSFDTYHASIYPSVHLSIHRRRGAAARI